MDARKPRADIAGNGAWHTALLEGGDDRVVDAVVTLDEIHEDVVFFPEVCEPWEEYAA